jgi:aminoglycoside/choline kinase family phosphotransferase
MNSKVELKLNNILLEEKIDFSNLKFLAGDASNRKYFNIYVFSQKCVLMYDDNSVSLENFIKVSKMLNDIVSIPKIILNLQDKNILIIEDFGKNKFSQLINKKKQSTFYSLALNTLIKLHKENKSYNLDIYTIKEFTKESDLFFDWFVKKDKKNSEFLKKEFNSLFEPLLKNIELIPKVFIHRDYHVDNLFYLKERSEHFKCGWIDYQDALIGPCVYDLVSLTQDARIDVSIEIEKHLVNTYLSNFNFIDKSLFDLCYKIVAIQRHLKVLGIFKRLFLRDKKKIYLNHIPRVISLLDKNFKDEKFKEIVRLIQPIIKNYD